MSAFFNQIILAKDPILHSPLGSQACMVFRQMLSAAMEYQTVMLCIKEPQFYMRCQPLFQMCARKNKRDLKDINTEKERKAIYQACKQYLIGRIQEFEEEGMEEFSYDRQVKLF